jgi:hypothetical protein
MYSRFLASALLGAVAVTAFCQTPPRPAATIPDYVVYDAFFHRVMLFDECGQEDQRPG